MEVYFQIGCTTWYVCYQYSKNTENVKSIINVIQNPKNIAFLLGKIAFSSLGK